MRKKRIENMKTRMSEALELPKDITLDLPKISIIGNIQALIENHRGIIEYNPDRIRVNSTLGVIKVEGEEMNLRNIASDDIIITGKLKSLEYM